ncbi:eukaryotic translation initiation factor eIF2A-domain-containing protein [Mucidula mucida]|nr:eukaryotic translation initiation factor eIF2A-domain-containing protein [Mucidula mucida]
MATSSIDANEDIDFSDIDAKYRVEYDDGLDNTLVLEKLLAKVAKEFTKKGCPIKPDDIFVPWDESIGKSKGFAFIDFRSADDANLALVTMHNHPFDAKHSFKVNKFADIERYANLEETYVPPETEEYAPREHLRAWLADPQGRDQYVTFRGDEVEIWWHGKPSQCEVAHTPSWKDFFYVAWSPLGTYIGTIHRQGVRLWGGPSFKDQQRFAHPLVKLFDFSPVNNISSPEGAIQGSQYFSPDDEGNNVAVWDIKSGFLLRTFSTNHDGESGAKKQMQLPALKWSPDDKYVARVVPDQMISVYELPSMTLQDKKSIKIEGVVDFEWCPQGDKDKDDAEKDAAASSSGKTASKKQRENMLAYWTPEVANQPARVTLLAFPSRTILRQKNLFNVTECKLYWQNQGDFLCVKVDRHTKTKKSIFCNLEIFRVREKDYPVEVVELKDTVTEFAWEPKGERFAIVSTNDPNLGNPGPGITIKTDVSFYQLERGKNDFKLLRTLPNRTSNVIRWSPRGRHVILATVGSSSKSELEFWDLDFSLDDTRREGQDWGTGIQLLGTSDHYGVTDVEWDPSGRYLATSASAWTHTLENGYAIWDFKGQELVKQIQDRFKQFIWRPRPRTLLSKEQQRQVRKNLKEYSRVFDEEDAKEHLTVNAELLAHRKRLVDEWNAWRARCQKDLVELRGQKQITEADTDAGTAKEEIEVWVEEEIETIEEVVVD